jgi:hypothetical protein
VDTLNHLELERFLRFLKRLGQRQGTDVSVTLFLKESEQFSDTEKQRIAWIRKIFLQQGISLFSVDFTPSVKLPSEKNSSQKPETSANRAELLFH